MTSPQSVLEQGAGVLDWAASWQRATMRREFDAADPVPGVAELQQLAAKLQAASALRGEQLQAALVEVSDDEIATVRRWEEGATGPSLHTDAPEVATRRRYADSLRALRELLELSRLRRQAGEAFYAYEQAFVNRIAKQPGGKMDAGILEDVVATGDAVKLREFIERMRRGREDLLGGVVA